MSESVLQYVGVDPFESPKPAAVLDVVFVHGLGGDPTTTWSATNDPEGFWPRWLAVDLPTINVWTAGYDSHLFADALSGQGSSLSDRASGLLDFLTSRGIGQRPVVFVTHSLGGLVVKQMLRLCHDHIAKSGKQLLEQTKAVVFCATPHSGSALATTVIGILKVVLTKHVKQLALNDDALLDLHTWFRNWASTSGICVLSYHETKKTSGVLVVAKASADPGVPGCISTALDFDHVAICKPTTHESQLYVSVKSALEALLASSSPHTKTLVPAKSTLPAIPATGSELIVAEDSYLTGNDVLTGDVLRLPEPAPKPTPPEVFVDYEYFTTEAPHDRRPLAAKLDAGGRGYEVKEAERRKERFAMSLRRHAVQASSLARYTRLMADVESRFKRHVSPAIANGSQTAEINRLVQTEVITPVLHAQMTETNDIDAAIVENALYYLTGNCHVRWDADKN